MVSGISTALGGYNAAMTRLDVAAGNIANRSSTLSTDQNGRMVNTPYVPRQVVQSSIAGGGVTTTITPVSPPSMSQYAPTDPTADARGIVQAPNTDLAQQLIAANVARFDATANLKSIRAQDEMMQQALDIVS